MGRFRTREVSDAWFNCSKINSNRQATLILGASSTVTRRRFLAAQARRRLQHRLDRFDVAGAATENTRQCLTDFGLADRLGVRSVVPFPVKQLLRGQ